MANQNSFQEQRACLLVAAMYQLIDEKQLRVLTLLRARFQSPQTTALGIVQHDHIARAYEAITCQAFPHNASPQSEHSLRKTLASLFC
jgi:hypothetical protein